MGKSLEEYAADAAAARKSGKADGPEPAPRQRWRYVEGQRDEVLDVSSVEPHLVRFANGKVTGIGFNRCPDRWSFLGYV